MNEVTYMSEKQGAELLQALEEANKCSTASMKAATEAAEKLQTFQTSMEEMHDKTLSRVNELLVDIAIIKSAVTDVKKAVFGNGTEGLKTTVTKLEGRMNALEKHQDDDTTEGMTTSAKVTRIEKKLTRWVGIFVGIQFTISLLIAGAINWTKLREIIP